MGESSRGLTDSKHVPGAWQCDDASNRPCSATGSPSPGLTGTSWQLVRFEGGDSKILTPDDRTKYAIEFAADGRLAARTDCNRERGTWKSSGTNQISFGPLALTRAKCRSGHGGSGNRQKATEFSVALSVVGGRVSDVGLPLFLGPASP